MLWRKVDKVLFLGMAHKDFRSRDACKATEVVFIDTDFHLSLQSAFNKGRYQEKEGTCSSFLRLCFFQDRGHMKITEISKSSICVIQV